jgi:hypothetical protein
MEPAAVLASLPSVLAVAIFPFFMATIAIYGI